MEADQGDGAPDSRPLETRIGDKNWKTRISAYDELRNMLEQTDVDESIFSEYGPWLAKMTSDANAGALDSGLDTALVYIDKAPLAQVRQFAEKVCINAIDKSLGARPATLAKGKALIMKLMEVDEPTVCAVQLLAKLSDKKPKIPPACLELLRDGISSFGARCFPIRDIISNLGPVFNGNNSAAREVAMLLAVDLAQWIGRPPFNTLLESLRSAQKSDFERLVSEREAAGTGPPVPSIGLRSDREKAAAGGTAKTSSSGTAKSAAPLDSRDFQDEVDVAKRLKATEFNTLVAEEKWSEQLQGLQILIDILGPNPKIKSGTEVFDILAVCKGFLRQGHVQVQVASLKIIALLADGLRAEFGSAVRPLTQSIVMKCKEKSDVVACLIAITKYCLPLESGVTEDIAEHIRNKKTPPHGRIAMMELTSTIAQTLPERMSSDALKMLMEASASCHDDPDPKVREACVVALAMLGSAGKGRKGDVLKHLTALETAAPRVHKRVMSAMEKGVDTGASTAALAAAKPAASAPAAMTAPAAAAPPKRAVASKPTKATSAAVSDPKKSAAPASASTAAEDDNVSDLTMSPEEAVDALGAALNIPEWSEGFQKQMNSSKWQDKVDALMTINSKIQALNNGGAISAPLVVYLKNTNSNFKIGNVSVLKTVLQVCCTAAEHSGDEKFSRAAAWELIKTFSDKLSDKKTQELVSVLLTTIAEATSPVFVMKRMIACLEKMKSPSAHQSFLEWLKVSITDFGAAQFPVNTVAAFCHSELENKVAAIRGAAVEVLGAMYHQLGPRFQSFAITDELKPAIKTLIENEFARVGHDPAAVSARPSRLVKDAAAGGAAASGGALPRMDLGATLDRGVVSDLNLTEGKSSWQNRKAAMEAIISAVERSAHYIEANKAATELVKALRARLNDTQANLKPIAATALGHMLCAIETEHCARILKAISAPLLMSLCDNKKAMRDAVTSALQMIVTQNGKAPADAQLLMVLLGAVAEPLASPVARLDLLTWLLPHLESTALQKNDGAEIAAALVGCMQDKTAAVRTLAEQVLMVLSAKSYVSKLSIDKGSRDLPPAVLRSMQSSLERISACHASQSNQQPSTSHDKQATTKDMSSTAVSTSSSNEAPATATVSAPVVKKSSAEEVSVSDSSFPLKRTNKAKRCEEFLRNHWPTPPEEPGANEMATLRSQWEPLLSANLYGDLFPQDKHGAVTQDMLIPGVDALLSLLNDTSGHDAAVLSHADLMLRWCVLGMCARETMGGLLRILLLVATIFEKIRNSDTQLLDAEAQIIVPHLIDRSGHKNDRARAAFKHCLGAAKGVTSPNKLTTMLLQGLTSKNKKTRAVCLEEIESVIDSSGAAVLGRHGTREIALMADQRDTDQATRSAALDVIYKVHQHLKGDHDKLLKLLGNDISDGCITMIEHRIKERERLSGHSAAVQDAEESAPSQPTKSTAVVHTPVAPQRQPVSSTPAAPNPAVAVLSPDDDAPFTLNITPPSAAQQRSSSSSVPAVSSPPPVMAALTPMERTDSSYFEGSEMRRRSSRGLDRQQSGRVHTNIDGVYLEVLKVVDVLLMCKPNDPGMDVTVIQNAKEYLKMLHALLTDNWSAETRHEDTAALIRQLPLLTQRLVKCMRFGFEHTPITALSLASQSHTPPSMLQFDVGLVSVSLACVFAMTSSKLIVTSLSEESAADLIQECIYWMVDKRLDISEEDDAPAAQIFKALNASLIKLVADGKPGVMLCALVQVFTLCAAEKHPKGVRAMRSECSRPLSRLLLKTLDQEVSQTARGPFTAPDVDLIELLKRLDHFFSVHPATPPNDDTPFCSAKTVLAQLIKYRGADAITAELTTLNIQETAFIHQLALYLASPASSSSSTAKAKQEIDPQVHQQLISIIDSIAASRDKLSSIRELHRLIRAQPEDVHVDIDAYLSRVSSTFRKFVLDTLVKLDSMEDPSTASSATGRPVLKPSTSWNSGLASPDNTASAPSGGEEALRILENLKRSKSFRSPAPTLTSSDDTAPAATAAKPTPLVAPSPRAAIHDKVRGTLSSITASLSALDASSNKGLGASDGDLAARFQKLKQMGKN